MSQSLVLKQDLTQFIGETSGDIPVYSLHRIRQKLIEFPPKLSSEMKVMLWRELVGANVTYRKVSGNDWNCLTSNNLVSALEGLDIKTKEVIDTAVTHAKEQAVTVEKVQEALHRKRVVTVSEVKDWFELHYKDLLYDMSGKIPWAIVMRLRASLTVWTVGVNNPFGQDIKDMVLDVAKEEGINGDIAEEVWKRMGGSLFIKNEVE